MVVALMLSCTGLLAQEPEMAVDFLPEESWSQARTLAQKQGKYIFVDAYTEWCGWCKVQDRNTFTDESVGELINEHFVSVKLDFERGDGVKLARKYRVQAYPTLLFFNPQGQLVGRTVGYEADLEKFKATVEAQLDEDNHVAAIGDPDVLDPGFPQFYIDAFGPNGERTRAKPEQVAEWLEEQEDLYSEVAYNVLLTMPLDEKWSTYFLENYQSYAERFDADEVQDKLQSVLIQEAYQAMQSQNEEALEASIERMGQYLPEEDVESIANSLRLNFYLMTDDQEKLMPMMSDMAANESGDFDNTINSVAWNLYEQSDDDEMLQAALGWMEPVLERNPENYMFLDTQAALLYKTGQMDEAKRMATLAIEVGEKTGEDVSSTEKLLEEIIGAMSER